MPIQATSLAIIMRPALLFVCWIASLSIVGEAAAPGWVTCGNLSAAYNRTACPATQTCTPQQWMPSDGAWGCCPFPNGVSCGGYTCCPEGTVCHNHGTYATQGPYGVVSICVPANDTSSVANPVSSLPALRVVGAERLLGDGSNNTIGDQVCKTGPPLPLSTTKKNVLIVGDSVSIGYTPWVAQALQDQALVQHSPWGADGGAEETQYGYRCLENLIRAPDGTPLSPDVLVFNWGLHNSLSGNCTYPSTTLPSLSGDDLRHHSLALPEEASSSLSTSTDTPCVYKVNCTLHKGTKAHGTAATKEDCCALCKSVKGCAAGVFVGTDCYFKSAQDVYEGCSNTSKGTLVACINPDVPAAAPECDPGQSGPPDEYAPYLQRIVDQLKATPALAKTKLLFAMTTPDMCNAPINDIQEQLNAQARKIMQEADIPIVDLYAAVTGECGPVPQASCFGSAGCFCPHCYGNGQLGYQWLTNSTLVPAIAKMLE